MSIYGVASDQMGEVVKAHLIFNSEVDSSSFGRFVLVIYRISQ